MTVAVTMASQTVTWDEGAKEGHGATWAPQRFLPRESCPVYQRHPGTYLLVSDDCEVARECQTLLLKSDIEMHFKCHLIGVHPLFKVGQVSSLSQNNKTIDGSKGPL